MEIFSELQIDHGKIRAILNQTQDCLDQSSSFIVPAKCTKLMSELRTLYSIHAQAEEAIFYRSLVDDEVTHDSALDALDDHRLIESLIIDLENDPKLSGISRKLWEGKLRVLRESVESHLDLEERDLFKKAHEILSPEEAEEMGEIFQEIKTELSGFVAQLAGTTEVNDELGSNRRKVERTQRGSSGKVGKAHGLRL